MKTWETINGDEIPYNKLEDSHLLNILKFIERKAKNGITVFVVGGGMGWDGDDIWCDEYEIEGEEVLERYDYKGLTEEAKLRNLIT